MGDRIVMLTKRTVDASQPEAERYILWDSGLKGFGLRVEASGTKAFLVRYRIASDRSSTPGVSARSWKTLGSQATRPLNSPIGGLVSPSRATEITELVLVAFQKDPGDHLSVMI